MVTWRRGGGDWTGSDDGGIGWEPMIDSFARVGVVVVTWMWEWFRGRGRDGDDWERRRTVPPNDSIRAAPDFSFAREGDVRLRNELDLYVAGRFRWRWWRTYSGDDDVSVVRLSMVQRNENESSWRNDVEWRCKTAGHRQPRCSSVNASAMLWLAAACRDDGGVDVGP
ncbi:hypothetical protein BD779DRAFT_1467038 [Infundibulicybe gibba]|nr:hypothetical protein BD779DRAFT_1467038 [Infundibulicybe gibba]